MKKVSLMDIKKIRKWALPAGIAALGFGSIALGQHGMSGSHAAVTHVDSQAQSSASPAPKDEPTIPINGKQIPVDKDGSTSVNIPGGKANVDVFGDSTRITTHQSSGPTVSNKQSNNVDVNINSQSTGKNSGTTHIQEFSTSSSNGSRSRTTTIFSTDISNHTSVSN